jgi:hypothetical protein
VGKVEDVEEDGWFTGEIGCRAPPDLVMANEVELVKRSMLVMKIQRPIKMHLVLPQHL